MSREHYPSPDTHLLIALRQLPILAMSSAFKYANNVWPCTAPCRLVCYLQDRNVLGEGGRGTVSEIMKLLISALGKPHLLHTTGTNPVCKATNKVTCSRFANTKALFHPQIRFLLVMEVSGYHQVIKLTALIQRVFAHFSHVIVVF